MQDLIESHLLGAQFLNRGNLMHGCSGCYRARVLWQKQLALACSVFFFGQAGLAQLNTTMPISPGSLAPKAPTSETGSAPLPGTNAPNLPYAHPKVFPASANGGRYQQLPLSIADAKVRLQELRSQSKVIRPQDALDSVARLCEWLSDIIEAHNKMAVAFNRSELTKAQSQAEKLSANKFAQVRNEAQLLRADLLIQQNRYPEALAPLVDIVLAEPTSPTGKAAYKKLMELGFSEEPEHAVEGNKVEAASLAAKNQENKNKAEASQAKTGSALVKAPNQLQPAASTLKKVNANR